MTLPYPFLMASAGNTSAVAAVDLDGANDFLSRSSDLVGNADGKVFTFSCFFYAADLGKDGFLYYATDGASVVNSISYNTATNKIELQFDKSTGTRGLYIQIDPFTTEQTFVHLLVSCDLSDPNKRHVYINDIDPIPIWTTYDNEAIDFTLANHYIGSNGLSHFKARLSHAFLDYTYRDLSIEANRRLFVTEDLKPASGQESLNPIIYCPMKSPEGWFENPGTGGDFTPNGTVALSQRGPNQDNCVASKFNGVDNYLFKTLTLVDSKQLTLAFTFVPRDTTPDSNMFTLFSGGTYIIQIYANTAGNLTFELRDASQAIATVQYPAGTIVIDKHYAVALTLDLTDVGKRSFKLNNVEADPSYWVAYNDLTIPYAAYNIARVGRNHVSNYYEQDEGEVWFDTVHTPDLSVFWDSEDNIPKPVRQVIDETGVTPVVALPIRADKAGTNLGTGGTFSASGIYVGARGMSEHWARSVVVDNANYLTYPGVLCASLIKAVSTDSGATWTISFLNSVTVNDIGNGTDNGMVGFYFGTSEAITWDEANKLRFVDALGYPIDIAVDSNTLIYHKFDDIDNLKLNLGTAGQPTEIGTIIQGSDVDPN